MRLGLNQSISQQMQQRQILAPRMIQSMEILQLPLQALQERIEQEMNENPLLEQPDQDPDLPEVQQERENPDAPTTEEKELVVDENKNNEDDFERLLNLDQDVPDYFDEAPRRSLSRMEEEADRKHDAMANAATRELTLHEHLEHQLGELDLTPDMKQMCVRIISALDSNGYLPTKRIEDLLPSGSTKDDLELAERALTVVQQLNPPGVGARDLRECLLLQLTEDMDCFEEVRTLVVSHLEDLRDNRIPAIQKKTGYSVEQIQEAWDELRRLNPKPGARFNEVFVPTVKADVVVERNADGKYEIKLEDGRTPSLRISEYYRRRLRNNTATAEEREFIKQKVNSAQWLIESIEQRRSTLTRVAQAIVDHQTAFLDHGPEAIEPLKMQQIADKVGVHVTTVSRAVDDKWIQTPRGLFPLKRFFVGGTVSEDGEEVAWDAIRIKLQELVDKEDKTKPLSDDELVRQLKSHGLNVARRTVTKYRMKMGIGSSRQRRVWTS